MNAQIDKKELIDWIANLSDRDTLESIQALKKDSEAPSIHWDDLPEEAKASIERGLEDSKAGRVISNEKFWEKYEHRL